MVAYADTASAASGFCPRPENPARHGPAKAKKRAPANVEEKRLNAADDLIAQGDYVGARAALTALVKQAREKGMSNRASLRLISLNIREEKFDEAEALAQLESARAQTPAQARLAQFYVQDARYRAGTARAAASFAAARQLYDANDWVASEVAFTALLDQPCPYAADFPGDVRLMLTAIALNQDNFAEARRRLAVVAMIERPSAILSSDIARMAENIDQKEINWRARQDIDATRAMAAAGQVEEAMVRLRLLRNRFPDVAPSILDEGRLAGADFLSRQGRFDDARNLVASVVASQTGTAGDPTVIRIAERAGKVRAQIDAREIDARARVELDTAKQYAHGGTALAKTDRFLQEQIAADPKWPARWEQAFKLRQANIKRRRHDYAEAGRLIKEVAADPAHPALLPSATNYYRQLQGDTPRDKLRILGDVAIAYDTNAPLRTSAVPGEEDINPYPTNRNFPDGAVSTRAFADYQHAINDRYDFLRLTLDINNSTQFRLSDINRLEASSTAGFVYQLPAIDGNVALGGSYARVWRGGDFLFDSVGIYASAVANLRSGRLQADYAGAQRNDRRNVYDGWRQQLSLRFAQQQHGWNFALGLRDEGARTADQSYTGYLLGAGYRLPLAKISPSFSLTAEIGGSAEILDYHGFFVDPNGQQRGQLDNRLRGFAALSGFIDDRFRLRLEYQGLSSDTNRSIGHRVSHRFGLGIRYLFDVQSEQPPLPWSDGKAADGE